MQPMELSTIVVEYVRYIKSAGGYSRSTVKAYQSQLRRFDRWLEEKLGRAAGLEDVSARMFRMYIVELAEQGCRPRTIRSAVMPVRSLCNYLVETGILVTSPIHGVRLPKKDAAQRPKVTEEELLQLVTGCERLAGRERSLMARALLLLLITTALRRSELLGLRLGDVDLTAEQVLVARGKGGKSRALFLPEDAVCAMSEWLKVRPVCKHDYVFVVDANRRLANLGLDTGRSAGSRQHPAARHSSRRGHPLAPPWG
jgi:site-specific recombinase XerD